MCDLLAAYPNDLTGFLCCGSQTGNPHAVLRWDHVQGHPLPRTPWQRRFVVRLSVHAAEKGIGSRAC